MKDPRVIDRKRLVQIRENLPWEDVNDFTVIELLDYIDLLHELVDPIQTAFLEREQERMGWRPPTPCPLYYTGQGPTS